MDLAAEVRKFEDALRDLNSQTANLSAIERCFGFYIPPSTACKSLNESFTVQKHTIDLHMHQWPPV